MQHYPVYEQTDFTEVKRLINFVPTALLATHGSRLQIGIFNPVWSDSKLVLHLNQHDPQLLDLKENPHASLIFEDILAVIPSYWVDPAYAGAATTYYRFAQLECQARLIQEPNEMISVLTRLMQRFQPEKGYAELSLENPQYRKSFEMLTLVELSIDSVKAKWKLGQNRSLEIRAQVIQKLRERNQGNDLRCVEEIERWMELNP